MSQFPERFVDPERRLPVARYQYVNVIFDKANVDTDIRHDLNPVDAEQVRYVVDRQSAPAVVYQDLGPNRRPWERTHIYLRASVPTVARILLYIETETDAEDVLFQNVDPEADEPDLCEGHYHQVHRVGDDASRDAIADDDCAVLNFREGTGITIDVDKDTDTVTISTTCCDDEGGTTGTECVPVWTTSPMAQAPPAADGVAIAGSGSAWTSGSWAEIEDSTAAEWVLAEIHLYLAAASAPTDSEFEVDIGVGASGAESVIATVTGTITGGSFGGWKLNYPLPAPIKLIPAASRVAARIRKSGTDTDTLYCSIGYYALPVVGEMVTTTSPLYVHPPASTRIGITPDSTAWANSAWTEITGATGTDWIIAAVYLEPTTVATHHYYELDIGIGAAGSETVLTTVRESWNAFLTRKGGPSIIWLRPMLDAIPAGSRVAVRYRKSTTDTDTRRCALLFYREHLPSLTTAQPQEVYPPAANNVALDESGFDPAYGPSAVVATSTGTWAVTGFVARGSPDSTSALPAKFKVSTDTASFEYTAGASQATTPDGADYSVAYPFAMDMPVNTTIHGAWAATSSGATWESLAITYIADPDFAQRGATYQFVETHSGGLQGAGAWTSGSWVELTPGYGADVYLVAYRHLGALDDESEIDIAIGDSGSETLITTLRCAVAGGLQAIRLPVPHKIASGNRIAARARSRNNVSVTAAFVFVEAFVGPLTCGPTNAEGTDTELGVSFQIAGPGEPVLVLQDGETLTLVEGSNIDLTVDAEAKALTVAATGVATSGAVTSSGLTMSTDRLLGRDTAGTGAIEELTIGAGLSLSGGALAASAAVATSTLGIVLDGGGSAITTGWKGYLEAPFACTITAATLLADQTGSIVIDVWKDTYGNFPPTDADSITASAPPTLSSAQKSQDSTLTGWTTSVSAGDILGFNVDSASTLTWVVLQLTVERA